MAIENPNTNKPGRPKGKPILKAEIEEAQRNTNSNAAAARYLNISYDRYKKYAKLYKLFESHKNESGVGIDKGYSKSPRSTPLREILEGKHPNYSRAKLKNRLVARNKMEEVCNLCGFNESRVTDNKIPLILSHMDGNKNNFSLDNLELLCYNCMFLTTGAPTVAYRRHIERSFTEPETIPTSSKLEPTVADSYSSYEEQRIMEDFKSNTSLELSEEEKKKLLSEIEDELK